MSGERGAWSLGAMTHRLDVVAVGVERMVEDHPARFT
jgi:hypothetical protein